MPRFELPRTVHKPDSPEVWRTAQLRTVKCSTSPSRGCCTMTTWVRSNIGRCRCPEVVAAEDASLCEPVVGMYSPSRHVCFATTRARAVHISLRRSFLHMHRHGTLMKTMAGLLRYVGTSTFAVPLSDSTFGKCLRIMMPYRNSI